MNVSWAQSCSCVCTATSHAWRHGVPVPAGLAVRTCASASKQLQRYPQLYLSDLSTTNGVMAGKLVKPRPAILQSC